MKIFDRKISHTSYDSYDIIPICEECNWVRGRYNFCGFSICPKCGSKLKRLVGRYMTTYYSKTFLGFQYDYDEEHVFIPKD